MALNQTTNESSDEYLMCVCGHDESMHVDGCEQCFDITCGCEEFEESYDEFEKIQEAEIDTI